MAAWPATLPIPLAAGYRLLPVDPVDRTDMEVGAARARRRTQARQDRVGVAWLFRPEQMAAFRAWYDDPAGAAGGAAWFSVRIDVGGGASETVEARFAEIWQGERIRGGWFRVAATLEVR